MLSNETKEAIMAFLNGSKIRDKNIALKHYWYIDSNGVVRDNDQTHLPGLALHPGIEYEIYEEPKKELKLENLKIGSILVNHNDKRRVLGIIGEVICLSYYDKHDHFCFMSTIQELIQMGYSIDKH